METVGAEGAEVKASSRELISCEASEVGCIWGSAGWRCEVEAEGKVKATVATEEATSMGIMRWPC